MSLQPPPPPPSIASIARHFFPAVRATLKAGKMPESEVADAAKEIACRFARAWLETLEALCGGDVAPAQLGDMMLPTMRHKGTVQQFYDAMDDSYTPNECLEVLRKTKARLGAGQHLPPEATSWLMARGNTIVC